MIEKLENVTMEKEKITIIEGPPPTFEQIDDGWAMGLNEGPSLYDLAITRLRTFNGAALVERCYRAWNKQDSIFLHYKNDLGLEESAPILAARSVETEDGQVLILWVRRNPGEDDDDIDFDDDEELDFGDDDPEDLI
ncbi:hypothetical protein ADN00_16920 [Ornatilinea apprima]|uniref:Uncharacterized protein n=2 Tax=Ornatilinea apprima TaxID=1134406 RepID=A0A0P6X887_9CHLR|nr:hypothetical protein ADN00_16920 [Ornatilinea apprima]